MFMPTSYTSAVCLMVITMVAWGSWANTQKLAKNWRFELFYWDYAFGVLLTSLLFSTIFGPGLSAIPTSHLTAIQMWHLKSAFLGGVVFNVANILLVAAIAIAGMGVAFPIAIGIALIEGTLLSFKMQPVGHVGFLIGGLLLVLMAIFFAAKAYGYVAKKTQGNKGVVLAVISGILMGLFYPLVVHAMVGETPLDPYSASVVFSCGLLVCNLVANWVLMKKPITGAPLRLNDYKKGSPFNHALGIVGGFIWCVGTILNFIASQEAGPAIAYAMGQGATLVAAIWGVFIWREFKTAPQAKSKLILMFICYGLGLFAIGYARMI